MDTGVSRRTGPGCRSDAESYEPRCRSDDAEGLKGDVRYLGEIDTTEVATRKLVAKLAAKYRQLTFCYEAGPTGYGPYRLIRKLGHDCIEKKPGVRVKTNRRDAAAYRNFQAEGPASASV
jgi:transposase